MTGGEVLIGIAINLGTGVPASLLANWIWTKLSAKGGNPVSASGSKVKSNSELDVQELAEKLCRVTNS